VSRWLSDHCNNQTSRSAQDSNVGAGRYPFSRERGIVRIVYISERGQCQRTRGKVLTVHEGMARHVVEVIPREFEGMTRLLLCQTHSSAKCSHIELKVQIAVEGRVALHPP